jgi:hypothetical protein
MPARTEPVVLFWIERTVRSGGLPIAQCWGAPAFGSGPRAGTELSCEMIYSFARPRKNEVCSSTWSFSPWLRASVIKSKDDEAPSQNN